MLGLSKYQISEQIPVSLFHFHELYAPVSGKIVETNDELEDSPEFVNESPYEKAWMVKVELNDESQLDELLSAEQYSEMIGE